MTVFSAFMKGVYDWLVLETGFDSANVFRRNQNNPDLGTGANWATYKEISGIAREHALVKKENSQTAPDEEVDTTVVIPGTSIVSVNIYAENGMDILRGLWLSRNKRAVREIFKTAKIVLLNMSGPREAPLLSETKWKYRYQADFTFNVFTESVETDYIVDVVDLTGKVEQDTVTIFVDRNG